MPQYWLVSVPANQDSDRVWHTIRRAVAEEPSEYAELCSLKLPQFKTGTLDGLMTLSDELVKHDQALESTTNKLADTLRQLLDNQQEHLRLHLTVSDKSVDHYIKTFQWNSTKYRPDRSLKDIVAMIAESVGNVDSTLKTKMTQFSTVKSNVQTLERKQHGNLAMKSLADVVRQEDCVVDSEYLQTVFVAVPRNLYKEWASKYEKLVSGVVPRSSVKITEDIEYGLFSVVIFKKCAAEFIVKCREEKFIVREFEYDATQLQRDRQELAELEATQRSLHAELLEWCSANFGEVFASWVHIKTIRVFTESVLRYGLPIDYLTCAIKPHPKYIDKVTQLMDGLYGHLEGKHRRSATRHEDIDDIQHLSLYEKDYRPYVCFVVDWTAE